MAIVPVNECKIPILTGSAFVVQPTSTTVVNNKKLVQNHTPRFQFVLKRCSMEISFQLEKLVWNADN
jgi:hypothetical protein